MNRHTMTAIILAIAILAAGTGIAYVMDEEKPTSSIVLSEGMVERTFDWTYNGNSFSLTLAMPLVDYYAAKSIPRGTVTLNSYPDYIDSDADCVSMLSKALKTAAGSNDVPQFILSFIQAMTYETDIEGTGYIEYPKYPIETLVDARGDCEDVVGLYISLLRSLGYDAVMIFIPTGSNTGHMAAGVVGDYTKGSITDIDGKEYYYAECTAKGWSIGQVPTSIPFGISGTQILGGA